MKNVKDIRSLVFVDPILGDKIEVNPDSINEAIRGWLAGEKKSLVMKGIDRIELYEFDTDGTIVPINVMIGVAI